MGKIGLLRTDVAGKGDRFVKGKMGYIDNAGQLRINAELERLESYLLENVKDQLIKVTVDGKMGLFDRAAKQVLPIQYSSIYIDEESRHKAFFFYSVRLPGRVEG